ncbi:protein kinase [Chloroflexia bacterium SDU3-3]|nr:protein kinase [Chloroflexia bacterium SDU3-3]
MPMIDRYSIQEKLGAGGAGTVYRSYHALLDRPVAIKQIQAGASAEQRERFLHEARAMASLSHPNIINILDIALAGERPYIVMELVEGGSLADRLEGGALPPGEAVEIVLALTDALSYAHSQGVIHRDLKPANVLLRHGGTPVLADFGIARTLAEADAQRLTRGGTMLGTPAYMAPEQFTGGQADARTDIYALGVMLFQMLTGRVPFEGDIAQTMRGHLELPPPDPCALDGRIPAELGALVRRMLAKSPSERPQSVAEVGAELRTLDPRAATGATLALARELPRRGSFLRWLLAVVGSVVLVVLAVAALLAWNRPTPVEIEWPDQPRAQEVEQPAGVVRADGERSVNIQPSTGGAFKVEDLARAERAPFADAQQIKTEPFSIAGLSYDTNDGGQVSFLGEIRNEWDSPRESIQIQITLLDAQGGNVGYAEGFVDGYLAPHEIAPFRIIFSEQKWPKFASYRIDVHSRAADFQLGYVVKGQAARDVSITSNSFSFELKGTAVNTSDYPLKFVQIRATFYDNTGHVVGVETMFGDIGDNEVLTPGGSASFDTSFVSLLGQPSTYVLEVYGLKP